MTHYCIFCLIYEVCEAYMQDIAFPYIVEVLGNVSWFGTDMDWEVMEETYFWAMHNSDYFSIVTDLLNLL